MDERKTHKAPNNGCVKKSYGIACCRFNKKTNNMEILLVKKNYSYNFSMFVLGRYNKKDDKALRFLFNGMTNREKADILSMRFDILWYKMWQNIPQISEPPSEEFKSENKLWNILFNRKYTNDKNVSDYIKKKNKFESTFLVGGGKRLRHLIHGTTNLNNLWEIPKGRKSRKETKIDCAIREFKEETGMTLSDYTMLFNVRPVIQTHSTQYVTYKNKYFIAYAMKEKKQSKFDIFNRNAEICDYRWVSLNEIKFIEDMNRLSPVVTKIFTAVKAKYKQKNM